MPSSNTSTPSAASHYDQPYLARILLPQHQGPSNRNSPQQNRSFSGVALNQLFYASPKSTPQRVYSTSGRPSPHFYLESTSPSLGLLNFQSPQRNQTQRLRRSGQMRLMNRPRIGDLTTRRPSNMMERALRILESKKKRSVSHHRTPSPSGSNNEKRSCRRNSQENNSHPATPVLSLPTIQLAAGAPAFACTSLQDFSSSQLQQTPTSDSQQPIKTEKTVSLRLQPKPTTPNTAIVVNRPSSAILPERVSCLSSAALEALAFGDKHTPRQSRKRRANQNDISFDSNRLVVSTKTQALDEVLLDDLDNSILSSASSSSSPVFKRAALRDIQTQTASTNFSDQQFVKPTEVKKHSMLKHTSSVSQFIAGLEARARANALMRSANKRSKSVLDLNTTAKSMGVGSTSLEARHANIRQLFANLTSSSETDTTSSSTINTPNLTFSSPSSNAAFMGTNIATTAPVEQTVLLPSTSISNLPVVNAITVTSVTNKAPATTALPMSAFNFYNTSSAKEEETTQPTSTPSFNFSAAKSLTETNLTAASIPIFSLPKSTTTLLSTSASPVGIPSFNSLTSTVNSDPPTNLKPTFLNPKVNDSSANLGFNPVFSTSTVTSTTVPALKFPIGTSKVAETSAFNFSTSCVGATTTSNSFDFSRNSTTTNLTSSNNNAPMFNFSSLPSVTKKIPITISDSNVMAPVFKVSSTTVSTTPAFNFTVKPTIEPYNTVVTNALNFPLPTSTVSSSNTSFFNFNSKSGAPLIEPAFNFQLTPNSNSGIVAEKNISSSLYTVPSPKITPSFNFSTTNLQKVESNVPASTFNAVSYPEAKAVSLADTKSPFSFDTKNNSTFKFSVTQPDSVTKPSSSSLFVAFAATKADPGQFAFQSDAKPVSMFASSSTTTTSVNSGLFNGGQSAKLTSSTFSPASATSSVFAFGGPLSTVAPSNVTTPSIFSFGANKLIQAPLADHPSGTNMFTGIPSTNGRSGFNLDFKNSLTSVKSSPGGLNNLAVTAPTTIFSSGSMFTFGASSTAVPQTTSTTTVNVFGDHLKRTSGSAFASTPNMAATGFSTKTSSSPFGVAASANNASSFSQPTKMRMFSQTTSNFASPAFGQTMEGFGGASKTATSTSFGQPSAVSVIAPPFNQPFKMPAFGQTTSTTTAPFGQPFAFEGGSVASSTPSTNSTTGTGFNFSLPAVSPSPNAFVFGGALPFAAQQGAAMTNPFSVPTAPNAATTALRRRANRIKGRR